VSAPEDVSSRRLWLIDRWRDFASGDRLALSHNRYSYSYGDLLDAFEKTRTILKARKIPKGVPVALSADYSLFSIAWLFTLYENKNLIVPISPACTATEAAQRRKVAQVQYSVNLTGDQVSIALEDGSTPTISDLSAPHAALVLFSSGTTGEPKAMQHNLDALLLTCSSRRPRALTILSFLLFDHIGGLNTLFNALASGAHLVIPISRDPHEVAALIELHQVRVLPTSPTFLNLFLLSKAHLAHDISSLRLITYGTEPMPESLLKRIHTALPRCKLLQTFGTSETGIVRTASRGSDSLEFRMEDPNIEYKVVDGELWLRSKTQVKGYLNADSSRFTSDGWFRTGDQVEQSSDGFLRILGRASEMINVGGEKVIPAEVESALAESPYVLDCRVFQKSHPLTGQVVAAEIVPHPDYPPSHNLARNCKNFLRSRLAAYKIPVYISFVEKIQTQHGFKKQRR
jgi:acyl-coenzyme A synthetase/AMP-(fatty) acid ligase